VLIRTQHGAWRLTAPMHKLLLTVHIVASVGWLGVTAAKLVLGVAADREPDAGAAQALLVAIGVVDRMFPPAAILTLVSGIALGLITKWGIVQYTWVLVKLVLTIAVPVTAVQIGTRLLVDVQSGAAPTLLVWLAGTHIAMLAAATVLSVYKPWGLSWFGRRASKPARSTGRKTEPPAPLLRGNERPS
jgi:hypothetical protein